MNFKIDLNINPNIFRGYDIRGIYGDDLDENVVYTIGLAYAKYIKKNGYNRCVVGRDNRSSSLPLSEALIKGILEGEEIEVIDIGLVTTPMYYYAQIFLNDGKNIMPGIMITASHNPKEYNGLKISLDDFGNACGKMIEEFRDYVFFNAKEELDNIRDIKGNVIKADIRQGYLDLVKKSVDINGKKIKAVVDTANGTASIIAEEMYNMFKDKIELIPLYIESDPEFPNHHPDPSVEENLKQLQAAVKKNKADIGLAYDGDADRIGVVDICGLLCYNCMALFNG